MALYNELSILFRNAHDHRNILDAAHCVFYKFHQKRYPHKIGEEHLYFRPIAMKDRFPGPIYCLADQRQPPNSLRIPLLVFRDYYIIHKHDR